jgi:5-methylcytosine-specific restriction endonuclease McrA
MPRRGYRHRLYRMNGERHFHALRAAAIRDQNNLCYWCKREMRPEFGPNHPLYPTGDHLIPLHAGGITRHGNIVAACRECNNGRHPELNRSKAISPVKVSSGQENPASPFSSLVKLLK